MEDLYFRQDYFNKSIQFIVYTSLHLPHVHSFDLTTSNAEYFLV